MAGSSVSAVSAGSAGYLVSAVPCDLVTHLVTGLVHPSSSVTCVPGTPGQSIERGKIYRNIACR